MSTARLSFASALIVLSLARVSLAELPDTPLAAPPPNADRPASERVVAEPDYLFPTRGRLSGSFSTGVPFVAIGEAAFGVSNGFAFGLIGGFTPRVGGFGIRPRGMVELGPTTRLNLVVPVLYYPRTSGFGNEPWVLTNPTLAIEQRLGPRVMAHAGIGLVAAGCVDGLFGHHDDEPGVGFMGGVWNTLPFGAAYRLTSNVDLFADAQLIMKGVRLAGEWVGGPPFSAELGVTTRF